MSSYNIINFDQLRENAKPWNYVLSIYVCVEFLFSFLLIGSLIYILSKEKWESMKVDMKLAYIMLIFDLSGAAVVFFNAVNNLADNGLFVTNPILCNLDCIMLFATFQTSIFFVGVVSLERCLLIVFKREYSDKFYFLILGGLSIINIAAMVEAWVFDGYIMYPVTSYCLYNISTPGGFAASILVVFSIGIADGFLFVCYPAICIYRRNQSLKAQLELGLDPVKVRKEVNRTILKSMLIVFASVITNGPYVVILIITWFNPEFLTPAIDCFQVMLIISNLLYNTFFLLNMKPELMKSLKKLWGFKTE